MSKILLFLAMLPSALWRRLGADTVQLKAILKTKLIIDNRKPFSFGNNRGVERKKGKKPRKYTSVITVLMSFFMGILYVGPALLTAENAVLGLTMFYTLFMFMLIFTMITDFATVLVDTKDKFILFARPVNDATIMLSRLIYIMIYLLRLVFPMTLMAWVIFGVIKGWKGVLFFPFPVVLSTAIVLFIVCAMYMIMMKLSKPGKFKDVLNFFQIAFSIMFFAVWMGSSRMMTPETFENMESGVTYWGKYLPTYWIATIWTWIDSTEAAIPGAVWMSIAAVLLPLVSLWATIKFLAPTFIKSLVSSDNNSTQTLEPPATAKRNKKSKNTRMYRMADIFNKNDAGKAGFIITWLQTTRSRNFNMKVLPSMAMVPVYFFFIIMPSGGSFKDTFAQLPQTLGYIPLLYMTTVIIMQAINYMTMSEQYKAAWVYYSVPLEKPGQIIVGGYKAIWAKYFLPLTAVISIFAIYIWGLPVLFDIVLATVNVTLFTIVVTRMSNRALPFSKKEQVKDSGGKLIVRMIGTFFLIGIMGVTHYGLSSLDKLGNAADTVGLSFLVSNGWLAVIAYSLKIVFLLLSSICLWLAYDSLKNTTWQTLQKEEELF